MGAGEAVSSGRNLQGWLARYPIIALRMAGEALAEGRPVPEQAVTLISNSPLPPILWRWLFTTIGTRTFRRQALANGIADNNFQIARTLDQHHDRERFQLLRPR